MELKYSKEYYDELKEIYYYLKYKKKEEMTARRLIMQISEKLKFLEIFPRAYKLINKKENLEYRKFIIKNYVIIYQINLKSREVNILHIYNQKQYK